MQKKHNQIQQLCNNKLAPLFDAPYIDYNDISQGLVLEEAGE